MRVLVAEDDYNMRNGILEILAGEGYEAVGAGDGAEALRLFEAEKPDFVCLDIMMPEMNGYDVCREIRRRDKDIPIIFLSAKSEEIDKVLGLELGADDYMMKPFGVREFVARLRAISRRCYAGQAKPAAAAFDIGGCMVYPAELRAQRGDGAKVELSLREVKLLTVLHANAGNVLDRDALFSQCWGGDHYPNSRTLDQHISKLRKKVELDAKSPQIIKTVRGVGYRYEG
jgi:two-component system alkaline phosphatase synthesis response regulator PhoP